MGNLTIPMKKKSPKFEYSKDQEVTYRILSETNNNVFLSGGAGTGKSFVLGNYIDSVKIRERKWCGGNLYPVLASTGVAAMLIGGRTLHSFFGLGLARESPRVLIERVCQNKYVSDRIRRTEEMFIDEISMVPAKILSIIDEICRRLKGEETLPFGGIRVITCGDFLQMPPVTKGSTSPDWAFRNHSWNNSNFTNCVLNVVHRTGDFEFASILNKVRLGIYDMDVYNLLKSRVIDEDKIDSFEGTRLFPFRASVRELNLKKLQELPADEIIFPTEYEGEDKYRDTTLRSCPVEEFLVLKEGALVMLRTNHPEGLFVNGTLAHVIKIIHDGKDKRVVVELESGEDITLGQQKFEYLSGSGSVLGVAHNFPLSLAWASTIHKSQGATIDRVCVDLRGSWETGQAYVALSRVKSREGLNIIGWDDNSISVSEEAVGFYNDLKNHLNDEDFLGKAFDDSTAEFDIF